MTVFYGILKGGLAPSFHVNVLILFANYIWQIDMTALRQMEDKDLKELGIPMVFSFP